MPELHPGQNRPRTTLPRALALVAAASFLACRAAPAADPAGDTWTGTWNSQNLWRSVNLVIESGPNRAAEFSIGTASEKFPAMTRSFAIDDTSLTAELDYAGATISLLGQVAGGAARGRLRVVRGETVLSEGTWSLERVRPADLTADEIMTRVRRALRFPGALGTGYTMEQTNPAEPGAETTPPPGWTARVGAHGEMAVSENGEPAAVSDGAMFRMSRPPFGWMSADARMRDKTLLADIVRSNAWLIEGGGLRRTAWALGDGGARRYVLELTTDDGVVPARIIIDPDTWLPERATVAWDVGERSLRFDRYSEYAGCLFPGRITTRYRERDQEWKTTRVTPGCGTFVPPATEGVSHDPNVSPVINGTHGGGDDGHLFVRPVVCGRDVGWFHVDTGAPFLILDTRVADDLGLEVVRAMGPRSMRRIPELRIGQLVLRNHPVFVMDLTDFSAPDSTRRAGVIGGPVFENAVVTFDYAGKQLSVFAPGAFPDTVADWQPLSMERAPVIDATIDGVSARFFIDTGKSGTLSLMSHAALRFGLHDGRAFEESANLTVEGTSTELVAHVAAITVGDSTFESPGIRLKLPGTTNDEIGTTAGIIGRGFFQNRRVVFDYAKGRIAFLGGRH